jgi:outer membrane protein OmpA-like peptidoglycan-associated protein/Tol biopolymer transport system component
LVLATYFNNTLAQDSLMVQKPAIGLNTDEYVEYAPAISADGKTMIFQSNREEGGGYKLYESKLQEDGSWSEPAGLDPINNFGSGNDLIGGPTLSFDGNLLIFFASFDGGEGREDIYYSIRGANGWGVPINVGKPINSPDYEGFPSLSADGKTLYFVKEESAEEIDNKTIRKSLTLSYAIYAAKRNVDGSWQEPERLPVPVNLYSSRAPRIMADNKTLIFSAIRSEEKLDYDLYQSRQNILGGWSFPVALDFVNTVESDQFSCISASGDLMYFVYAGKDIYSVEIPEDLRQFVNNVVSGSVIDADSEQGIAATLVVTDALTTDEVMTIRSNPEDGRYTLVLAAGRSYNIEIKAPGYSSFTKSYDLRDVTNYQEMESDFTLFSSAKLTVNVSDIELFESLEAKVLIKEQGSSSVLSEVKTNPADGRIVLDVPLGKKFEVFVSAENFKASSFPFDLSGLVMYRNYERDIELVPEKVKVLINVADLKNNSKVRSKILIRNKSRDEVIEVSGNEYVTLRAGDRYEIEATSDQGYAFNSTTLDLTNVESGDEVATADVSMQLMKLEVNAKLELKEILFESNSFQLSEISYIELERVIKLMKENPDLRVEISAHTDDVGSDQYNLSLSDKRAQSVVDYLIDNQVSPERFTAKGYGESQPLVPNDSEENKAKNRRVELKVLSVS